MLSALSLSTFPVLYFFTFLYYTDSGSTFFTLFTYLMCLYRCHKAAALLAVCAVLFRQTNIIWVAFCAGTVLAQKMDETWKTEQSKKRDEKTTSGPMQLGRVVQFVFKYATSPTNIKNVFLATWPYGLTGLGFLVFVIVNNGIVVGDRTSHEACLNFPQLFYFCSFALVFSLPTTLCYQRSVRFLQSVRKHPVLFLLIAALSLFLVWRFTFVHKYLLADNRHFPFYVWMRIYQRHELVRFLLVPVYLFSAWNLIDTLKSRSPFWILAFSVCLVAATVPQKLLEFRYFILPYLFYRLHIPLPSLPRLLMEFALYTAVNAATICLFLYKTFQWPDSPAVQRFMW